MNTLDTASRRHHRVMRVWPFEQGALLKRIVKAMVAPALALALVLPVQAAAPSPVTTSTLFVSSLNCQYREQRECVNVVTTIKQDATGSGVFCVGVADFHELHAPFANGCATISSAQISINDSHVTVHPTVHVPAVYTGDCHMSIPEDRCVPGTLDLDASASFTAIGLPNALQYTRRASLRQCIWTDSVRSTRVQVVGSVTIDGFVYDLSGTDPTLHHFEAWLVRESTRMSIKCR